MLIAFHSLKTAHIHLIHALCTHTHQNLSFIFAALSWRFFSPFIPSYFPLLFVTMEPLILGYYYYDEGHNVLETMEVLSHVDLIIIRKKKYDFYHVNTLINLKLPYCWR